MFGRRTSGSATLRLHRPTALPAHMRGAIVELSALRTEPASRGQGHAEALMFATTLEADLAGVMLFLHVDPENGTDRNRLSLFYARHGFLPIQSEPLLMVRPHVGMRGNHILMRSSLQPDHSGHAGSNPA